jgi:aromatic-L-amino-acid decarboxylase
MPHEENEPQGVDRTLEYSRPLRALKLWLAFEVHGAAAIRGAIERNLGHAALLAALVEGHPDLELVVAPQLSVVCFRHRAVDSVRLTHLLQFEGRVYVSGAEVDGAACLRACFVNHRTTDEDVHALVDAVVEAAGRL